VDIIIHWVTQIIIFLLLAAIIDLLIPKNSMKKYVKLVIGLILMLIFLKPLFYLFHFDIKNDLESSLTQLYEGETSDDSIENLIKMEKTDIQASQRAYILEQMANQLKAIANTPLIENHQVEIASIDFLFSSEQELSYEHLEEVIVYLQEPNESKGAVTEIDEVIIFSDDEVEMDHELDIDNIKSLLKELWEIRDKRLTIKWGGGTS